MRLAIRFSIVLLVCLMAFNGPLKAQENSIKAGPSLFTRKSSFLTDKTLPSLQLTEVDKSITPANTETVKIEQLVIVLDVSNSMRLIVNDFINHLEKDLPLPAMPTMVVAFSDRLEKLSEFTTSQAEIKNAIKKIRPTGKNTGVYEAIRQLKQLTNGRPTHVMLITDGYETMTQKVNVADLSDLKEMTVSYVRWGLGDTSQRSNEEIEEQDKKPEAKKKQQEDKDNDKPKDNQKRQRIIKLAPNSTLKDIAVNSGGDIISVDSWKIFTDYLKQRVGKETTLYRISWQSTNPESPFQITSPGELKPLRTSRD